LEGWVALRGERIRDANDVIFGEDPQEDDEDEFYYCEEVAEVLEGGLLLAERRLIWFWY
jgi:hypothetical protein